ncbi:DUF2849 domain-containing protein [Enhygromyxa salina]|uniref:DUF2849 domain-containing protein n=1 Tax=Enhygromyxa salina TaxID=215803 RepID=A0A2S9YTT3_9BACT|nr:DUF2849 domain-containing protein [Enhygromyxa salina]PRQ08521.1 hypothetical protein ENSA7_18070 [Enhygromyxa salina]
MKLWIITGSATESGAPIYLQTNNRWTHKLSAGHPIASEAERQSLLDAAKAQQRKVCDPYWIEVRRAELGHLAPVSLREKIRAEGPTISLVSTPFSSTTPASRPAAASA